MNPADSAWWGLYSVAGGAVHGHLERVWFAGGDLLMGVAVCLLPSVFPRTEGGGAF